MALAPLNGNFKTLVMSIVTVLVAAAIPAVIHLHARQEVIIAKIERLDKDLDRLAYRCMGPEDARRVH